MIHHEKDANLMSAAGLVPVVRLAQDAGLRTLADEHLSVTADKGANAGRKVMSLVRRHGRRRRQH